MKFLSSCILFIIFSIPIIAQKVHYPVKVSDDQIIIDGNVDSIEWRNAIKIDLRYETEPGEFSS